MRWLAYVHPALMVAVLALGVFVLREGLRIRRSRLLRRPLPPVGSRTHRRWARVFVLAVSLGYAAGLLSMALVREQPLAASVHFPLATLAAAALVITGALGLALERGAGLAPRTAHALIGTLGLLFALTAAIAGMAILP